MSLRDWISKLRAKREHPTIMTPWGPTTESMRRQAETNMANDPELRARCEAAMVLQMGDFELAMKEMRRRYPRAYENEQPRKGFLR